MASTEELLRALNEENERQRTSNADFINKFEQLLGEGSSTPATAPVDSNDMFLQKFSELMGAEVPEERPIQPTPEVPKPLANTPLKAAYQAIGIKSHPRFKGYEKRKLATSMLAGKQPETERESATHAQFREQGRLNRDISLLQFNIDKLKKGSPERVAMENQRNLLEARQKDLPAHGFFNQVAKYSYATLPMMVDAMTEGIKYGMVTAMGMGVASAATGPAAPLAVGPATVAGFTSGTATGAAKKTYEFETGAMLRQFEKEGVPDRVARPAAHLAGAISGGMEATQFGLLYKSFPALKYIINKAIRDTTKRVVINSVKGRLAKAAGKQALVVGKTLAGEVAVEDLQQVTQWTGNQVARAIETYYYKTDKAPPKELSTLLDEIKDTTHQSALAFLPMVLPGPSIQLYVDGVKATQKKIEEQPVPKKPKKKTKKDKPVPEVDKKTAKAVKDQPSLDDLEKGEQREPTEEEKKQQDKAIDELGIAEEPVEDEVEAPKEPPKKRGKTTDKDIEDVLKEETRKVTDEAEELTLEEIEERLKAAGHVIGEIKDFKYNQLTQPAVIDRDGNIYTGDKIEQWSPTKSGHVLEPMLKSYEQAKEKAGNISVMHGFKIGDKFVSSRTVAGKNDLLAQVEKKKVKKSIEKEEKLNAAAKKVADRYKKWRASLEELTPLQRKRVLAADKKIRGMAGNIAANRPGIDKADLEQVGREAAIKRVREGKQRLTDPGAMRNFASEQLTKGTASRATQQRGLAPEFTELKEATTTEDEAIKGTLTRREQMYERAKKKDRKVKTLTERRLDRAIAKRKKQLAEAEIKTRQGKDIVFPSGVSDKSFNIIKELREGTGSVFAVNRRLTALRGQLKKAKKSETKARLQAEIEVMTKAAGMVEKEPVHKKAKAGGMTAEDLEHKRYLETHGIIVERGKPSPKKPEGRELPDMDMTSDFMAKVSDDLEVAKDLVHGSKGRAIARVTRRITTDSDRSPYRALVNAVLKKYNLKLIIDVAPEGSGWGRYSSRRKTIFIYPENFLTWKYSDGTKVDTSRDMNFVDRVVAHEVLHGITANPTFRNDLFYIRFKPFIKSLEDHIKGSKTVPGRVGYLFDNFSGDKLITELISEAFTNPDIAEWLSSIKADTNVAPVGAYSMWAWLKNLIAKEIRTITGTATKMDELMDIMESIAPYRVSEKAMMKSMVVEESTQMLADLNLTDSKEGLVDEEGGKSLLKVASEASIKSLQSVWNWLDIEAPWKRIGAHETGRRLRQFFSRKTAVQVEGIKMARNFVNTAHDLMGKISKEEWADIVFQAENPKHIDTLENMSDKRKDDIRQIAERLNFFFDQIKNRYTERGVNIDWSKRMMLTLEEKLEMAEKEVDKEEIEKIKKKIEKLKGTRFVHVPIQIFFEKSVNKMLSSRSKRAQNKTILNDLLAKKKRHILRIKDIVDKENSPLKKTDVDPVSIMMNYMYRVSKDMAMLDLRDAMKKDKLIKLKTGDRVPRKMVKGKQSFGMLSEYYMRPEVKDMISELLKVSEKQNLWIKAISLGKMAAFFNPIFLPMYDVMQSIMSGALWVAPQTIHKNIGKAFNHVFRQTDEYQEAMRLGLFSKPFDFPWKTYKYEMASIKRTAHVPGARGWVAQQAYEFFMKSTDLKKGGLLGALYNASWNTAWKLDECIRMFTYLQLQKGGHSKLQAAETSAQFHGDYASVPPQTRRKLNYFFFTPTFKIVMGKVYVRMLKQVLSSLINLPRGKPGFKDPYKRQLLIGAVTIVGINAAFDAIMGMYGLEPEDKDWWNWGRRYTQKAYGEFGPREFVLNWSHPGNMVQRYFQKAAQAWKGARREGGLKAALNFLHWDLHPFYTTAWSWITNRKPNGEPIWNENDNDWARRLKVLRFNVTNIVRLGSLVERDNPVAERDAKRHINKQWGQIGNILFTSKFSLGGAYTRSPKIIRQTRELNTMKRQFNTTQRQYFMKHGRINQTWIKNYQKRLNQMLKEDF
jgi:hypothetical protein